MSVVNCEGWKDSSSSSSSITCSLCGITTTTAGEDAAASFLPCEVGIRLLFRFLKLKSWENNCGGRGGEGGGGGGGGGLLCSECYPVVHSFWAVYQDYEKARLLLCYHVEVVSGRLKTTRVGGGGDKIPQGEWEQRQKIRDFHEDALLRQCSRKMRSTPRVSLADIGTRSGVGGELQDENDDDNHNQKKVEETEVDATEVFVKTETEIDFALVDDVELDGGGGVDDDNDDASMQLSMTALTSGGGGGGGDTFSEQIHSDYEGTLTQLSDDHMSPKPQLELSSESSGTSSFTCSHCSHVSTDPREHQHHVLCNHPIEFFNEDLPPQTDPGQLEKAIQKLIDSCERDGELEHYKCTLCGWYCRGSFDLRVHVLEVHFEVIVDNLGVLKKSNRKNGSLKKRNRSKLFQSSNQTIRRIPCRHCQVPMTHGQMRLHLAAHHTLEYYQAKGKSLPPATTQQDLDDAVSKLIADNWVATTAIKNRIHCFLCERVMYAHSRRLHISMKHADKVLDNLVQTSTTIHNTNSSNQVGNFAEIPEAVVVVNLHQNQNQQIVRRQGPTKCSICGKTAFSTQTLRLHMKRLHNRKSDNIPKRRIKCVHCEETFRNKGTFRIHQVSAHVLEYFKGQVPAGTTAGNIDAAVESVIAAGHIKGSRKKAHQYHCSICSKELWAPSRKFHVLKEHQKHWLSALSTTTLISSSHSPPRGISSECSNIKIEEVNLPHVGMDPDVPGMEMEEEEEEKEVDTAHINQNQHDVVESAVELSFIQDQDEGEESGGDEEEPCLDPLGGE